jgi:hypothetical protein
LYRTVVLNRTCAQNVILTPFLHLHRLGIYEGEPICRKCGMGEETAHHILFECEALGRIRYSVLGPSGFELGTIHQEPIKPLPDLIRKAGIFEEV